MRLIAAIEDPMVVRKIPECLKLPARSPPLAEIIAIANPAQQRLHGRYARLGARGKNTTESSPLWAASG